MWALILIQLNIGHGIFTVDSNLIGRYNSIHNCFLEREAVILQLNTMVGKQDPRMSEYPPANTQLVCIKVEHEEVL